MTAVPGSILAGIALLTVGLAGCTNPVGDQSEDTTPTQDTSPPEDSAPAYLPRGFWNDTAYNASLAMQGLTPWSPVECARDGIGYMGPEVRVNGLARQTAEQRLREFFPPPWQLVQTPIDPGKQGGFAGGLEDDMEFLLLLGPGGTEANLTLFLDWAAPDAWTTSSWWFKGNASPSVTQPLATSLMLAAREMASQEVGAWNVTHQEGHEYVVDPSGEIVAITRNYKSWILEQEMQSLDPSKPHRSRYHIAGFSVREPDQYLEGLFFTPLNGTVRVSEEDAFDLARAYEDCRPGNALMAWCSVDPNDWRRAVSMGHHRGRLVYRVATCAWSDEPRPRCSGQAHATNVAIDAYTGATLGQFEYGDLMKSYEGGYCEVV